jgi:hypothetical protein
MAQHCSRRREFVVTHFHQIGECCIGHGWKETLAGGQCSLACGVGAWLILEVIERPELETVTKRLTYLQSLLLLAFVFVVKTWIAAIEAAAHHASSRPRLSATS